LLTVVPSVFMEAIATRAINTISNAYSVKSWPSSSFHNLAKVACMCILLVNDWRSKSVPGRRVELQRPAAGKAATFLKTRKLGGRGQVRCSVRKHVADRRP